MLHHVFGWQTVFDNLQRILMLECRTRRHSHPGLFELRTRTPSPQSAAPSPQRSDDRARRNASGKRRSDLLRLLPS